ncbi:MAG: hypothetical protein IJ545_07790 [Alphaproteobacteria bacterium]|nr:hypothetical protein [Alphaproteobacteria bacterium]
MKKIVLIIICCFLSWDVAAGDKELFRQVYDLLLNEYIEDVEFPTFFDPLFSSIEREDKDIDIVAGASTVTIYYKGKIHKVYAYPTEPKNAKKWAEFTDFLLTEVKKISPVLAHKDFELAEVMLYDGTRRFDKNMKYFPILDVGQKQEKIQAYNAGLQENGILYIRLGTINDYTTGEIIKTFKQFPSPKGIILDLRENKGGYLKQALDIADVFLSKGLMIYTIGKNQGKRKNYVAEDGELYKGIPMVVLVDGQTASAAEVIALSLQKNKRATIVGAQTYGKGTVQNIYKLENEAHLALTTEKFFGFGEFSVENIGMRPDVCSVVFNQEDDDMDKIVASGTEFECPQISRHSDFDLDVAEYILKKTN